MFVTYTLDDNQKLRLRREHGKIQELEKNNDEDRKESMHWMFAVPNCNFTSILDLRQFGASAALLNLLKWSHQTSY